MRDLLGAPSKFYKCRNYPFLCCSSFRLVHEQCRHEQCFALGIFKRHNASFAHSSVVFSPPCTMFLRRSCFVLLPSVWFGERLGSVKVKVKVLRWSTTTYEVCNVGCVLFWCTAIRTDQVDP